MRLFRDVLACLAASTISLHAQLLQPTEVISLPQTTTNGVAVRSDGRIFLVIAKQPGQHVPQVAAWENNKLVPYPTSAWNAWKPGEDASAKWVHANAIRFDPEGILWVVDAGAPDSESTQVKHGPKLVGIETKTGKVKRTLFLDDAVKPQSFVDDVRFNGDRAYLTDAGAPGLIVLHMPEGMTARELDGDASTTASKPTRAAGKELRTPDGKPVWVHADQLELSPDAHTLYYQPICGPMSAIDTQFLDNMTMKDAERRKHVRLFAETGSTGGTAIDAQGNLYVSLTDRQQIARITPSGKTTIIAEDPRFIWGDALWLTADGRLWLPAAQNNLTAGMNGGTNEQKLPGKVYTLKIGIGPPVNDHR